MTTDKPLWIIKPKVKVSALVLLLTLIFACVLLFTVSACTSMTKGVVQAFMEGRKTEDTRRCWIRGREFAGLESMLQASGRSGKKKPLKILKVHGIGSHRPGYSGRLVERLTAALDLHTAAEDVKNIQLTHPDYPNSLGVLQVHRFIDLQDQRELVFYELTWDSIVEAEKQTLAFDSAAQVSDKRTDFNHMMKSFVNDTVPDALMYNSQYRQPIQLSVSQALCWMLSETWSGLPLRGRFHCDINRSDFWAQAQQDVAIISHSLGSRIAIDALQSAAVRLSKDARFAEVSNRVKDMQVNLYMLSNQLPLLQLGQQKPEVSGDIVAICDTSSERYTERFFKKLQIVAFSDPNDLFSYTVEPQYVDQRIDSRLCPSITNVVINVARVADVLGLQEFANPLKAHTEYEVDSRVIALLAGGFGPKHGFREVKQRCQYIQALPSTDIPF